MAQLWRKRPLVTFVQVCEGDRKNTSGRLRYSTIKKNCSGQSFRDL
jgi:hypothetical protein